MTEAEIREIERVAKNARGAARHMSRSVSPSIVSAAQELFGIADALDKIIDGAEVEEVVEPVDEPVDGLEDAAAPIYKPGKRWGDRPGSGRFSDRLDRFLIDTEGQYRNLEALGGMLGRSPTELSRRYVQIKDYA